MKVVKQSSKDQKRLLQTQVVLVTLLPLLFLTASCSIPFSKKQGCDPVPKTVLDTLRAKQRTNYRILDKGQKRIEDSNLLDHFVIGKSAMISIPIADQKFGMTKAFALTVATTFHEGDGIVSWDTFASNSDGTIIYPLTINAEQSYNDLPVPKTSDWEPWAKKLTESHYFDKALACVMDD